MIIAAQDRVPTDSLDAEDVEQTSRTLHVKNLPRGFTRAALTEAYVGFGALEHVQIAKGRGPFGFVRFQKASDAEHAFEATQAGQVLRGNKVLQAFWAKKSSSRSKRVALSDQISNCASADASTTDCQEDQLTDSDREQNRMRLEARLGSSDMTPEMSSRGASDSGSVRALQQTSCAQMKPDCTLLIAHFPWECYSNDDVRAVLAKFGHVLRVNLITDADTSEPKCYGFVEFAEHRAAAAALSAAREGHVVILDKRGHPWHMKAEWTRAYATARARRGKDLATTVDKSEVFSNGSRTATGPMAPARTLLVAYFPREATKEELGEALSMHGAVSRVHLIVEKETRKPKCYGFVEFQTQEAAAAVLAAAEAGAVTMIDGRQHKWHLRAERVRAFVRTDMKQERRQREPLRRRGMSSGEATPAEWSVTETSDQWPVEFPAEWNAHWPTEWPSSTFPSCESSTTLSPDAAPFLPSSLEPTASFGTSTAECTNVPQTLQEHFQREVDRKAAEKAAEIMAGLLSLLSAATDESPEGNAHATQDENVDVSNVQQKIPGVWPACEALEVNDEFGHEYNYGHDYYTGGYNSVQGWPYWG